MKSGSGSRSRSRRLKVRLSVLVLKYLQESRYTYATVLTLAAVRPISRKEMLQVATLLGEELDVTTLKSWLHYQVIRGYLEKTGVHGLYKIGPAIEPDLDETRKILQEHDIDLEQLDKLLQQQRKHRQIQQLIQVLAQEQELVEKLLDPRIRNLIKQILDTINDVSKIKTYYMVKCRNKIYLTPIETIGHRKIGNTIKYREQEHKIIGIAIQEEWY